MSGSRDERYEMLVEGMLERKHSPRLRASSLVTWQGWIATCQNCKETGVLAWHHSSGEQKFGGWALNQDCPGPKKED